MKPRVLAAGVLASLWLLGLPTWAVEYRLQVVNLNALTVLAHIDNTGRHPMVSPARAILKPGSTMADFRRRSAPGATVQLLHDPGYGGTPPTWLQVLPNTRDSAWTRCSGTGIPANA